ncbi:cob(II)yrinic acid a,c-diamide reductase [Polaromonas sp. CF318]|nr:cob(II)yrinic acid a,c-diamide reductase [Polaromonas sp. CF318]
MSAVTGLAPIAGAGPSDPADPADPAAAGHAFSAAERQAVYRAIHERRDMRHFSGGTVADELLQRLLSAAHHAPSVGFMQPWRFIRVRSRPLREGVHALVEQERVLTAKALGEREDEFMKLKVQGVLDAAEVLVVALPPGREQHVFGRRTLPEMDLASAACAIQNLWLAARAEGLGMGWVSIFEPQQLAALLRMPEGSKPIAVLCLGPVAAFYEQPMLQAEKWARRAPLADMVFEDLWGAAPSSHEAP